MEQKLVKVPFEVELAKKITNGGVEGRIVTDNSSEVRIVCFDMLDDKGHIIGLRKDDDNKEIALTFNDSGYCVQNPSRKLMLEIPEYMTFKDGDIVTLGWENEYGFCKWVSLIKSVKKYAEHFDTEDYTTVCLDASTGNKFEMDFDSTSDGAMCANKSTEEEVQILIGALKASKEPKAKEYLKRFFGIEKKEEYEFKPFDKVLVKDHYEDSEWRCSLFSHKNEDGLYICVSSIYEQCIPYEGNEHLLGTTDKWEEK